MPEEEQDFPIARKVRTKNRDQEDKFQDLRKALKNSDETRKDSNQATFELMLNLANQKLEEIQEEQQKLAEAMP